jgi:hypothetical protein
MVEQSLLGLENNLYGAKVNDDLKKTLKDFKRMRGLSYMSKIKTRGEDKEEDFGSDFVLLFTPDGPNLTNTYEILCHLIAERVLGSDYAKYVKYFMKNLFRTTSSDADRAAAIAKHNLDILRSNFLSAAKVLDYDKGSHALLFKACEEPSYEIQIPIEVESNPKIQWRGQDQLLLAFLLLNISEFEATLIASQLNIIVRIVERNVANAERI